VPDRGTRFHDFTNEALLSRALDHHHSHGVIMLKLALAASLTLALVPVAFGQAASDHVKIDLTRADLQTIGRGIMKLPYETAAPLLIELQNQLQAQTPKVEPMSGGGNGTSLPNSAPAKK
jgi:hypothetical protein